jgi:hypothetical protein
VFQISSRNRERPVFLNDTNVDIGHGHVLENQLLAHALRHLYMFRA